MAFQALSGWLAHYMQGKERCENFSSDLQNRFGLSEKRRAGSWKGSHQKEALSTLFRHAKDDSLTRFREFRAEQDADVVAPRVTPL